MRNYWSNIPVYSQPSVQELRRRAEASVSSARRKGQTMEPAIPQTRSGPICQSWWGQAWCRNLEGYADYSTRLERGRRYIRSGTVLDLKIHKGRIEARVQGSRRVPYKVEIRISPLSEEKCQLILEKCGRRIRTMEDLIYGRFPEELKDLFTQQDGLFPRPTEISFMCSCPDWALMCKHVAAVMYGVGLRLDENPFYFFELRGIDVDRFIDVALDNKVERMLENASAVTSRIMDTGEMGDLFGILGPEAAFPVLAPVTSPEEVLQPAMGGQDAGDLLQSAVSSQDGGDSLQPAMNGQDTGDFLQPAISGQAAGDFVPETTTSVEEQPEPSATAPLIFFQGNYGQEISHEAILAKVYKDAPQADHIYIKPADGRAYWTAGEQCGSVELW